MHKYHCDVLLSKLTPSKVATDSVVLFPLHLTEFIAVTSYQSPEVSQSVHCIIIITINYCDCTFIRLLI